MSGPVTPPLTVSDVDDGGSVTGRPITTIEVTDGTLSIAGNVAKVTTGGGGGSGTVTSITAAADSGTGTAITTSGTFTFTGGTGVTTSVTGTTVTFDADNNGDVVGPSSAVDSQVVLFDGTTGQLIKDGGKGIPTGAIVGTTDSQTLTNKTIDVASNTVTNYEGTAVISTGEGGGTKFLREDGDGTCSWQTPAGGGAPTDASYVVLGVDGTLTDERVLTAGTGITLTDAGAGSTLTIDADQGDVTGTGSANNLAYWTGTDTISDSANFSVDAPSGTLDVFSYVEAGSNRIGSGGSKNEVTTSSATDLVLNTYTGTNSGTITITEGVDGAIDIAPNGAGLVKVSNLEVNGAYALPTVVTGSNDYVLTAQTDGTTAWADAGGGGSPGGSTTQVQYNDAGAFAGSANFTFDGSSFTVNNQVKVGDGSAADPTFNFSSNAQNGMYKSGSNEISLSAAGGQMMSINSSRVSVKSALSTLGTDDLVLSTNAGTNSGTITIEDGVNGSIEIAPDGSGLLKVTNLEVNGAYALPTVVTGTNDYVLTAQTDGTTAWAEAGGGGGGNEYNIELPPYSSGYDADYGWDYTQCPTIGSALGVSNWAMSSNDHPLYQPFISPNTGNIAEMTIHIAATASSTSTLEVGVYSDNNGVPDSKIGGVFTFDLEASDGDITETVPSSEISVTRGTQYW